MPPQRKSHQIPNSRRVDLPSKSQLHRLERRLLEPISQLGKHDSISESTDVRELFEREVKVVLLTFISVDVVLGRELDSSDVRVNGEEEGEPFSDLDEIREGSTSVEGEMEALESWEGGGKEDVERMSVDGSSVGFDAKGEDSNDGLEVNEVGSQTIDERVHG